MNTKQLFYLITFLVFFSCTKETEMGNHVLRIKGSESMHEAFEALSADFESLQDSVKVIIEGGGSRTGLNAIRNNEAHIGLSSFRFNIDSLFGSNHGVQEHVVAYDGIVVVSNLSNPLTRLTYKQISGVFSGHIRNWSEIDGRDGEVIPVFRDQNSGTQRFFTSYFKIDSLPSSAVIASDNSEIVSLIKRMPHAIGFIGFSYFSESIQSLPMEAATGVFVIPAFSNLRDDSYPLKRPLQIYFRENGDSGLQAFLQYLESEQARSVFKMHGLMPQKRLLY